MTQYKNTKHRKIMSGKMFIISIWSEAKKQLLWLYENLANCSIIFRP